MDIILKLELVGIFLEFSIRFILIDFNGILFFFIV